MCAGLGLVAFPVGLVDFNHRLPTVQVAFLDFSVCWWNKATEKCLQASSVQCRVKEIQVSSLTEFQKNLPQNFTCLLGKWRVKSTSRKQKSLAFPGLSDINFFVHWQWFWPTWHCIFLASCIIILVKVFFLLFQLIQVKWPQQWRQPSTQMKTVSLG